MITKDDFIRIILKEIPDFQKDWSEHLAYWDNEVAGICNDMSVFSRYVVSLIINKQLEPLPKIFTLIEQFMVEGDNVASGGRIDARKFVHLLGPESKAYCQAWDEFTGVSTPGL